MAEEILTEKKKSRPNDPKEVDKDAGAFIDLLGGSCQARLSELDASFVRNHLNPFDDGFQTRMEMMNKCTNEELKKRKKEFAGAGFRLPIMNHDHSDLVVCPKCMLGLYGWTSMDDPMYIHAQLCPKCPHVLETKYRDNVESAQPSQEELTIVSLDSVRCKPRMYRLIDNPWVWYDAHIRKSKAKKVIKKEISAVMAARSETPFPQSGIEDEEEEEDEGVEENKKEEDEADKKEEEDEGVQEAKTEDEGMEEPVDEGMEEVKKEEKKEAEKMQTDEEGTAEKKVEEEEEERHEMEVPGSDDGAKPTFSKCSAT